MSGIERFQQFGLPSDCDPEIAAALDYWIAIKPGDRLPGRQDFDPTDIPNLLPGIWLIDVRSDPLRFVFRLVGTNVVSFFGEDPTGRDLNDVFGDFEDTVAYVDFREVVEKCKPRWRRGTPVLAHREEFPQLERIYLPLAGNGEDVDMIFCLSIFNSGL